MKRLQRVAWILILVVDVGYVAWGAGAAAAPGHLLGPAGEAILPAGYEGYSGGSWSELEGTSPLVAGYMTLLYRMYGIYNVLFGLRAGAEIVVMDGFDTGVFAELVARFGIRSTVLPPAAMAMLSDDATVVDLAPLRYVRSITAPLSPFQARRFADKFGVIVLNGYGQAEIGEVIGWTAADAKGFPEKVGAVGRPHPGVEIRVVGDESQVLEPGETGRDVEALGKAGREHLRFPVEAGPWTHQRHLTPQHVDQLR